MNELTRDKYLLPDEETNLLCTLARNRSSSPRDVTLLEFMYASGIRGCEALALTRRDLCMKSFSIYIRGAKSSRHREVPLPLSIATSLSEFEVGAGGRLFPFGPDNLRRIWLLYRPCRKGIHSLRHTAAINLYKKTRDIKMVQLFLGHRSLTNTQIYVDFVYSAEALRSALCPENSPITRNGPSSSLVINELPPLRV